jgi:hypothetical protein
MNLNVLQRNWLLCSIDPAKAITHPHITAVAKHNCKNLSEQKEGHRFPFSSIWKNGKTSIFPQPIIRHFLCNKNQQNAHILH